MSRTEKPVDILLIGEGTYPYIRGGVSSWIHQLIRGLPELRFGIVFLGSSPGDYGEMRYELPENLVHLEKHYLFDDDEAEPIERVKPVEAFKGIEELYRWFRSEEKSEIPETLRDISFYTQQVTRKQFLYGKQSWEFIRKQYEKNSPDLPFIDYFWTVRSIHQPVWKIASIVEQLPPFRVVHSPSTGYAGFLGALASYHADRPFLLTEHGIYTRERKIDMLTADWVKFQKPTLLKQPEEFNYIKKMWVNFFEQIGLFSYHRAKRIYSLFPGARTIQIRFGADEAKTEVIPNGVDVDGLRECYLQRTEKTPRVITLIGRVVSIKDIKTFIRSIRIVANEMQDIEAWVVGPLDEDPIYAEECRNMVRTLSSISEGMPLTILEGFAAGIPCVATDVGSCRDLICGGLDDADLALGDAGIVTPIANPSALAAAYIKMLGDTKRWQQAQQAALKRVERYYREDSFLERYAKIYREVS